MKKNGVEWLPSVDVLGGEDSSVGRDVIARDGALFEHKTKGIARFGIRIKIQVEGEYLRQAHGEFGMFPGCEHRLKQRTVERGFDDFDLISGVQLLLARAIRSSAAEHAHFAVPGIAVLKLIQFAVPPASKDQSLAGLQLAQAGDGL